MVMRAFGRYSLAVLAGALAGLAWGVTLAMFQPKWVETLPNAVGWIIPVMPIVTVVVLSRYAGWWTGPVQAVYTAGLLCSWVVFDWYNLHMADEFINWAGPATMWAEGTALLAAVWLTARTARRESSGQNSP